MTTASRTHLPAAGNRVTGASDPAPRPFPKKRRASVFPHDDDRDLTAVAITPMLDLDQFRDAMLPEGAAPGDVDDARGSTPVGFYEEAIEHQGAGRA